jgi:hypothetical protein
MESGQNYPFPATANLSEMGMLRRLSASLTCIIQEPGANAGENPAANLNDLVGSSSNFEDIPAIFSMSVMGISRQLTA